MKRRNEIIKIYRSIALYTLNTLVLILLLNLVLGGIYWISDSIFEGSLNVDRRVLSHREEYSDVDAYTHMAPEEVDKFLDEQDAMGSIGFQHEPWIQFRNPQFHGTYLNTDARGLRKTKDPESREGVPTKIFVFGGSTTYGYGVSDDYTIPSFIQSTLERQYPDSPISVKNYAQGFYYSTQEMLLLISLIKENHIPHIAIFIDGANDTHQLHLMRDQPNFTRTVRDLWNTRGDTSFSNWEKEYSWVPMIRLAKVISRKLGPADRSEKTQDPTYEAQLAANGPAYVVNRYKSNLRIIRSICREYGIKCYFVWHPVPFYKYDRSLHRTFPYEGSIPKHWSATYKIMKYYSSPDFLYLGESLANVREKVFVDDVHFNEEFNAEIASAICEFLKPDIEGFVFR